MDLLQVLSTQVITVRMIPTPMSMSHRKRAMRSNRINSYTRHDVYEYPGRHVSAPRRVMGCRTRSRRFFVSPRSGATAGAAQAIATKPLPAKTRSLYLVQYCNLRSCSLCYNICNQRTSSLQATCTHTKSGSVSSLPRRCHHTCVGISCKQHHKRAVFLQEICREAQRKDLQGLSQCSVPSQVARRKIEACSVSQRQTK
jgi:hypothetical protein